ncbi:MAG TPA: hypothetical protein VJ851_03920 [Jatrophihabitans sp.]|nr:hypothetical protein [Jatrophihabitans sp.]
MGIASTNATASSITAESIAATTSQCPISGSLSGPRPTSSPVSTHGRVPWPRSR